MLKRGRVRQSVRMICAANQPHFFFLFMSATTLAVSWHQAHSRRIVRVFRDYKMLYILWNNQFFSNISYFVWIKKFYEYKKKRTRCRGSMGESEWLCVVVMVVAEQDGKKAMLASPNSQKNHAAYRATTMYHWFCAWAGELCACTIKTCRMVGWFRLLL